jgi:hypothetical protein
MAQRPIIIREGEDVRLEFVDDDEKPSRVETKAETKPAKRRGRPRTK